ncbi:MAG TPA: hypothetical protein VK821_13510 [Dehalococcoidia bacterium]|nr:hypothetical protein [Dehalococcoidia bacterium]
MVLLKGCPRCGGDLVRDLDDALSCLQCGHELAMSGAELLAQLPTHPAGPGRAIAAANSAVHRAAA